MKRALLLVMPLLLSGCILLAPPHRVAGLPSPGEVAACAKNTKACPDEYRR